jgi:PAS domain S-box-containing protein
MDMLCCPDGMIIVDKNYKINKLNNVAARILGIRREELIGVDIRTILKDVVFEDILSMKSSYLEKTDCDFIVNSNRIPCNIKITPVKTNSQLIGMVIMFREMKYIHKTVNIVTGNKARYIFDDIITVNDKMKKTIKDAQKFARTRGCVLIEGESGTGKELFAHSIHNFSNRKDGPFVAVNCASIPRELVESELFGYERGAFTGAVKEGKPGKFELANGGTIFLDEIGELPLDLQAKLLRVLDSYTITRIGGKYEKKLDVRVVCATNRNLLEEVKRKNFREDLYYRLNVFKINIPPLRERKEDIKVYIEHFIDRLNRANFTHKIASPEFISCAENYIWKGNVRELENVVERAYYLCDEEVISEKYLPDEIRYYRIVESEDFVDNRIITVEDVEKQSIIKALIKTKGHVIEAGKMLNMSKSSIYRKINKYNIDLNLFR